MTTRRDLLTVAAAAALLSACRPARDTGGATTPDTGTGTGTGLVLADTAAGLTVLSGGRATGYGLTALATPTADRIYLTRPAGSDRTELHTIDVQTGRTTAFADLAGRWVPRVVSSSGHLLALTPAAGTTGVPAPRDRSPLLIADSDGLRHQFEPAGIVEPDAFTVDQFGLFVLEWLPAGAPTAYRVRLLSFDSGTAEPLLTRDKEPVPPGAEEEMRGDGRQSVLSPSGQVLYTLYTHQPDHRHTRDLVAARPGGAHAFVHVLHLHQRWAYCLDLPEPFGQAPPHAYALALTADGAGLYVADTGSGRLALADTETLTVTRVSVLPSGSGPAHAAVGSAGPVHVGHGDRIHLVDGIRVTASWTMPAQVRGLYPAGAELYVGTPDGVSRLDPVTGAVRGRLPLPGLTALRLVR